MSMRKRPAALKKIKREEEEESYSSSSDEGEPQTKEGGYKSIFVKKYENFDDLESPVDSLEGPSDDDDSSIIKKEEGKKQKTKQKDTKKNTQDSKKMEPKGKEKAKSDIKGKEKQVETTTATHDDASPPKDSADFPKSPNGGTAHRRKKSNFLDEHGKKIALPPLPPLPPGSKPTTSHPDKTTISGDGAKKNSPSGEADIPPKNPPKKKIADESDSEKEGDDKPASTPPTTPKSTAGSGILKAAAKSTKSNLLSKIRDRSANNMKGSSEKSKSLKGNPFASLSSSSSTTSTTASSPRPPPPPNQSESTKEEFVIAVMGGGAAGKSSLIVRLLHDEYEEGASDPTLLDEYTGSIDYHNAKYVLRFLDTAGQEQYFEHRKESIEIAHAYMLVYDISQKLSFEEISLYVNELCRIKGKDSIEMPIVIVGNKCDMPADKRKVTKEEGAKLAKEEGCRWIEASAKSKHGVEELKHAIMDMLLFFRGGEETGWMLKQGGIKKDKWQKRWFVLHREKIFYYKTKTQNKDKPNGHIDLNAVIDARREIDVDIDEYDNNKSAKRKKQKKGSNNNNNNNNANGQLSEEMMEKIERYKAMRAHNKEQHLSMDGMGGLIVEVSDRTYVLNAPNKQWREEWIYRINRQKDQLKIINAVRHKQSDGEALAAGENVAKRNNNNNNKGLEVEIVEENDHEDDDDDDDDDDDEQEGQRSDEASDRLKSKSMSNNNNNKSKKKDDKKEEEDGSSSDSS